MTHILDTYEVKQGFNSARDCNGNINYPQPRINSNLKLLYKELQKAEVDTYSIACYVNDLDSQLTTDYFWWRFNSMCDALNKAYDLGLTLNDRPSA
tara:strand:+ start:281 stop:568 length:288 start_codon:yes stop_codon:yes gene_type:complete